MFTASPLPPFIRIFKKQNLIIYPIHTEMLLLHTWLLITGWTCNIIIQEILLLYVQGVSGSLSKCWSLLLRLKSHLVAQTGDIFFLFIGTFWYLVSKKFHHYSEIIHLCSLGRLEIVEIWKIHWKLRSKQRPILFCKCLRDERWDLYELFIWYLLSCGLKFKISNFITQILILA